MLNLFSKDLRVISLILSYNRGYTFQQETCTQYYFIMSYLFRIVYKIDTYTESLMQMEEAKSMIISNSIKIFQNLCKLMQQMTTYKFTTNS